MPDVVCGNDENVVRCIIASRHLQGNFLSPALFFDVNVSVSRLSVLSLSEIQKVYRAKFKGPTARAWGTAAVGMSTIKDYEREIHSTDNIYLMAKPTKGNDAHAEICPAITLEVSTALVENCINEGKIQAYGDLPPSVEEIQMG